MDREQFNELDRLIKITEFESKVQDKAIYDEREMVAAYEREINQLNTDIERMEKEAARNEKLSLKYERKIGQSRENYESLKKTSVVLDDHLEALTKKAAEAKQEAMERSEKMRSAIEYYTLKWEEYKKKYESTELGQAYVTTCREIEELEIKLAKQEKKLEGLKKAQQKKDPITKIKPWIIEFAELGVMAKKSSAEVKELDIINDSLLSKIEQMKLEIDDATAKLHEKPSNNSSNLVPAHPPPVGPGDDQISTSKRPRIDPTITTSWASKLKTFSVGSSVRVNNPRPSSTDYNPGTKPDSGPPNPRPLASVLKPVSTLSNPLTAKLTTVSRPSINIGSPLMTRPMMRPRPPSIQNPLLISKPPSIETPPMTSRPLTLEIPPVVSKSNPIIANPSSIANNPSLLSRPLAVNSPISRPSAIKIPVSRPLRVELPVSRPLGVDIAVSRPLVSSSEIEPGMSMETLEPIDSMEIPQGQESGLNFYYGEMQQEGLPQEEEEESVREDIANGGGLGGTGGFMSGFFNEAAASTVSSSNIFSSMSGGGYSQSVGNNETAGGNFPDIFSSAIGGQEGGNTSGGGDGGTLFSFLDAKMTDTGMFGFFGGESNNNDNTDDW